MNDFSISINQLAQRVNIITINEIKKAVNDLINDLLKKDSKIVFIIDELDRCRPDYAVKLLETITHFYDNDKIIFLVSCNSQQLSHTVSKFYGEKFDGYGYLNKIFNFVVSLEKIDASIYIKNILKIGSSGYFESMALGVSEYFNFSMREIGKYMYYVEILHDYYYQSNSSRDENNLVKLVFLPYCLALKLESIQIYNLFINGSNCSDFINFYNKNNNCKTIVDRIYNSALSEEKQKTTSVEEYIKDTYSKYFTAIDNNRYWDKKIREDFLDVLSLISNFSSLT